MLTALLSVSLLAPMVKNDIEVSVAVTTVDSEILSQVGPSIDQIINVRPNYPSQPIERTRTHLFIDGNRTASDIEKLNNIESMEVLRGPQGTLYGRTLHDSLITTIRKFESDNPTSTFNPTLNIQPNGWTRWTLSSSYKDLIGDTQVFMIDRSGASPTRTLLGRHPIYLGTYQVPDEPKSEFISDNQANGDLFNQIGGIRFKPEFAEKLGTSTIYIPPLTTNFGQPFSTSPLNYLRDCSNLYGKDKVDGWIRGSGLPMSEINNLILGSAAQGEGMNKLQFPGDPDLIDEECGSDVSFPPGTTWVPDRPGYQAMVNYTPLRFTFEPQASIDGAALFAEMRTHCLNIDLKEPAKGVRYFPYAPTNPVVGALSRLTEKSLVRGPWDQARTWIFTDKASMDQINERLVPAVSPSRYLSGLWDVVRLGGLGPKDMANKKVMVPSLLLVQDARADSFGWLSSHLSRSFPNEVAAFVAKDGEVQKLLASSAAEDRKHAGRLVRSLLSSGSPAVRKATLEQVLKSGGEGMKDEIGDLRASLYSADAKEVELALQSSERFQTKRPAEALHYLAAEGASPQIKAKAKSLLEG